MMRVIFAGSLQADAALFQQVVQGLPDCVGIVCADLTSAWQDCLDNEPDLLLVDASISSGMTLVEKFRAQYADIPILMIAGRADSALRLHALKSGVSDFLDTPLDEVECLLRMRNLLALRQSRQELVKRTAWLADEVNQAYLAMEQNATQAQEISEIAEANLKLEQANRNKNDTLARVSHDLRAPLATILGYSELLSPDESVVCRAREVISRNAHHVLGMIDELLEFARNTIGHAQSKPEQVYLQDLLEHLMQQVRVLAEKSGNQVALESHGPLPDTLMIDVMSVKRILSNLLSNAAKFTRNGTVKLVVSVSGDQSAQVHFEVIDSGSGIAAAELEHIFEPFYRAERAIAPGTGLGLAICRQLSEAMGGRITVESSPGKGSCFALHLTCPVVYEADINPDGPLLPSFPCRRESGKINTPPSGQNLEIDPLCGDSSINWIPACEGTTIFSAGQLMLLVEDEEEIRQYLSERLMRAGFAVITAENGRAAMDVMSQNQEKPVAVITDQDMPEMDGWALLSALRDQYGETLPVILFSSGEPKPPLNWSERVRFDAILLKSVDSGILLNALAHLLMLDERTLQTDNDSTFDVGVPGEAKLKKFYHWAEQGQVSILETEALKLAEKFPEYASFADFVLTCCAGLEVERVAAYCKSQLLHAGNL
jgi:signal transduction histidine kinase